ncbi:MAG TPA: hypothetical protein VG756_02830, partial [Pseudonocardiaceae bacterium]|nr:hypothetical protein [Pseudonocardiaceae bacterium]
EVDDMLADIGGFAGVTEAVAELKTAATTGGGFTISDDGANTLTSALNAVLDQVNIALAKGVELGHQPALGTTPAANTLKPFLATIWSDGAQGGQKALAQLKQDLSDAIDTIKKSSASYQRNEQHVQGTLA